MHSVTRTRVLSLPVAAFLVSWVGSLALLISPAVAQAVNGSGPSASSLFDRVFNLPGDESAIPGDPSENSNTIGGGGAAFGGPFVTGTTQLNVISGGIVGDNAFVDFNTEVNISGGTVGAGYSAFFSEANISGGTIGNGFSSLGAEVEISGGTFGNNFVIFPGSVVNVTGSQFAINGVQLTGLMIDQPFEITDRDVLFSAVLADGGLFEIDLNSARSAPDDSFSPDATLTVTLVASPIILGDVNQDGEVSYLRGHFFVSGVVLGLSRMLK